MSAKPGPAGWARYGTVLSFLVVIALVLPAAVLDETPESQFRAMTPEQVRAYEAEALRLYRGGDRSPGTAAPSVVVAFHLVHGRRKAFGVRQLRRKVALSN